jgi:hypothetical protein
VICGFANNTIRTRATVTVSFFPIFTIVLLFHLWGLVNDLSSAADDRADHGANGGADSHYWLLNGKRGLRRFADPVSGPISETAQYSCVSRPQNGNKSRDNESCRHNNLSCQGNQLLSKASPWESQAAFLAERAIEPG